MEEEWDDCHLINFGLLIRNKEMNYSNNGIIHPLKTDDFFLFYFLNKIEEGTNQIVIQNRFVMLAIRLLTFNLRVVRTENITIVKVFALPSSCLCE